MLIPPPGAGGGAVGALAMPAIGCPPAAEDPADMVAPPEARLERESILDSKALTCDWS